MNFRVVPQENTDFDILDGYLSPVNDEYNLKKLWLVSAHHRAILVRTGLKMCTLATEQESSWLIVDPWEAFPNYQRTDVVFDYPKLRMVNIAIFEYFSICCQANVSIPTSPIVYLGAMHDCLLNPPVGPKRWFSDCSFVGVSLFSPHTQQLIEYMEQKNL